MTGLNREPNRISVIIPTLNEARVLPLSLKSLEGQTVKPFEALYIDGGSTDATKDIIMAFSMSIPSIRFIVKKSMNEAASRNFGAGIVHGDVILFSSADVIFHPKTVEAISSYFDSDSKLIALAGRPMPITAPTFLRFEYQVWHNLKVLFLHLPRPFKSYFPSSSFLAVKTKVFLGLGGFDPERINNDGFFGVGLMSHGKVLYCPEIPYSLSSRRYIKSGMVGFNKQFSYNIVEDVFPIISKFSWLDGFRRAFYHSHKPVT